MAVAGSAVPVVQVWLENGQLKTGYAMMAHGDVVDDDVVSVARRVRSGEEVYLLRQGFNLMLLEFVIGNNLYPKEEV